MPGEKLTYHVYDPGYPGIISVHDTLEQAIEAGNETIKNNWQPDTGDEWSLDIDGVAVYLAPPNCEDPQEDGELVAQAAEVNRVDRPDDVDDDGYSESTGDYWPGGYDYVCDYAVQPTGRAALQSRSTT